MHVARNKAGKQDSHNIIAYSFQSSLVGKVNPIWDFWLNGQKQRLEGDCFALNYVQRRIWLSSKQCQCRSEDRPDAEANLVIQKSSSFKVDHHLVYQESKSISSHPEACALCLHFTGHCLAYNKWVCAGLRLREIFISANIFQNLSDHLSRESVLRLVQYWTKRLHTLSFIYFSLCLLSLSFSPLSSSLLFLHFSHSIKDFFFFFTAKAFANIWP